MEIDEIKREVAYLRDRIVALHSALNSDIASTKVQKTIEGFIQENAETWFIRKAIPSAELKSVLTDFLGFEVTTYQFNYTLRIIAVRNGWHIEIDKPKRIEGVVTKCYLFN